MNAVNEVFAKLALAILALIFLVFIYVPNVGAADLFVQVGLGETIAFPKNTDGTWFDSNLPHQFHGNDIAVRIGAGVQFNSRWSATVSYLQLGKNSIDSLAVSDACFAVRCTNEAPQKLHVTDNVQGAEFAGIYTFQIKPVQPYVRAGLFLAPHTVAVDLTPPEQPQRHVDFHGIIYAPFIGAGVKWKYLWADVSYYHFSGSGFPPAGGAVVPMIGGRYEF